jgi:hypothetical protein
MQTFAPITTSCFYDVSRTGNGIGIKAMTFGPVIFGWLCQSRRYPFPFFELRRAFEQAIWNWKQPSHLALPIDCYNTGSFPIRCARRRVSLS